MAGGWVRLKLHRYLFLEEGHDVGGDGVGVGGAGSVVVGGGAEVARTALPALLCGLGAAVVAVASVACHCAVRGAAAKLYMVSFLLLGNISVKKMICTWYCVTLICNTYFYISLVIRRSEFSADLEFERYVQEKTLAFFLSLYNN